MVHALALLAQKKFSSATYPFLDSPFMRPRIVFMPNNDVLTRRMITYLCEIKDSLEFDPFVVFADRVPPTSSDPRLTAYLHREYDQTISKNETDINFFYQALCDDSGIQYLHVPGYNTEFCIDEIVGISPVAAITMRVRARLNANFINTFRSVLDVPLLNLHPGPLPQLRGVHSIIYGMLRRSSRHAYTIHEIDEKYDTGPIVEVASFEIDYSSTVLANLLRSWKIGIELAIRTLTMIARIEIIEAKTQGQLSGEYNSAPTSAIIDLMEASGIALSSQTDLAELHSDRAFVN